MIFLMCVSRSLAPLLGPINLEIAIVQSFDAEG